MLDNDNTLEDSVLPSAPDHQLQFSLLRELYYKSFSIIRKRINVNKSMEIKLQLDKMSEMCGKELKAHNVTCISLWPGVVQTEAIVAMKDKIETKVCKH